MLDDPVSSTTFNRLVMAWPQCGRKSDAKQSSKSKSKFKTFYDLVNTMLKSVNTFRIYFVYASYIMASNIMYPKKTNTSKQSISSDHQRHVGQLSMT